MFIVQATDYGGGGWGWGWVEGVNNQYSLSNNGFGFILSIDLPTSNV